MKKEFMNPELEVLRFQKGVDVLLTSDETEYDSVPVSSSPATSSKSLSRGIFDNSVD